MQRAEYIIASTNDISELRHSALNFDLYTHFTSPIRRYPDIIVHRQMKHILSLHKDENDTTNTEDKHHNLKGYDRHIDHFNEKYTNGKMISSKCQKLFHCLFLKLRPSLIYKALIIDINSKGGHRFKRGGMTGGPPMTSQPANELSISLFIPEVNLEIVYNPLMSRNGRKRIILMF